MKIFTKVRHNKTGETGHLAYADLPLDPKRIYGARFKGLGGGYVRRECKGSELSIVYSDNEQLTIFK